MASATDTGNCNVPSSRMECTGVQGTGSKADICFAADCCENTSNPDCSVTQIRDDPPEYCTGEEAASEACSLAAPEGVADTCGVSGIEGIAAEDGLLCCPIGCGTCGGDGCDSVPMSWVAPGDDPLSVAEDVSEDAASAESCCMEAKVDLEVVCGQDGGEPPCLIPQPDTDALTEDTCGMPDMVGISDDSGTLCCPTGCGRCGGAGCGQVELYMVVPGVLPGQDGAPEGAKPEDYCCVTNVSMSRDVCGVNGTTAPCLLPTPAPTSAPTLAPFELPEDTCGVQGMSGVADSSGERCCPLGCGMCGGTGCGSVNMARVTPTVDGEVPDGASAQTYCCSSAFTNSTDTCGENGGRPPCYIPESTPAPVPTVTLPPVELPADTCGVEGISGIADETNMRCCPSGCGMCGGSGCGSVDMALVAATVEGDVPEDAKASQYCCVSSFTNETATCGEATPPCVIPVPTVEDSCYVEGIEGVADDKRENCCPIGCGMCGGDGCGAILLSAVFPGQTFGNEVSSSSFCCASAFTNATETCGPEGVGVEPPCKIPEGVVVPTTSPTPGPMPTTTTDAPEDPPTSSTQATTAPTSAGTGVACDDLVVITDDEMGRFDGTYIMDDVNEILFTREDGAKLLTYVADEEPGLCGHWVLANTADGAPPLQDASSYPWVQVLDRAGHPEDIDPDGSWQEFPNEDAGPSGDVAVVIECGVAASPQPTPAVSSPMPANICGFPGGTPCPSGPTSLPSTIAPSSALVGTPRQPNNAPQGADVTANRGDSSGGGGSDLTEGQAIGIGIGAGVVVLVGAVMVSRWAKRGESTS